MKNLLSIICIVAVISVLPVFPMATAAKDKFVVVIDAGHGGNDPGAVANRLKEKNINLDIALKLGKLIQKNCPDVNVIFTRNKDVFVTLKGRTEIGNKAKADLFISIHTNSAQNASAKGTETYVYGLEQANINMEVAKRENSVILLEKDYSTTYQGYDPNSVESFIMFDLQQNKYLEQSVHFASMVQEQFRLAGHPDRSVRQQNLLVLRLSAMPSILVEVGYVSNPSDAAYLGQETNREKLAESIYKAFVSYKNEWNRKQQHIDTQNTPSKSEITYKIQLMATKQKLSLQDPCFKGLSPISYYEEGGWYKYTYGEASQKGDLSEQLTEAKRYFKDAYIVSFKNGKRTK
ncbi:MAG: N-acetylmuramoyl-L-alanine amidase [Porphyromonadaceae bacterium]|nr:N-acetylmuramoyl-L-alanine amidase [Porphyromonadaceae bacterium]MCD8287270.1 N-acetylmuramoyl-L-alanine amidase [Porphyromonadaceae bacterium]